MPDDKQELIDQFHKNSIELVEINLTEWKSQLYVDIRIFALNNPAERGSEVATKKGICISVELLPRLIKALEKAQARVKAKSEIESESGQNMYVRTPERRTKG